MNPPPIFIVGSPRSGTTLLRNMLNRHPRIAICRETQFNHYIYSRRTAFGDLRNEDNRCRLVKEYLSTSRMRRSGIETAGLEERLLRDGTSYASLFASLMEHFAESEGKQRCGEKTPQHALLTETFCEWYPGAAIIHLVRDPREVVASLQRVPWASNSVVVNTRMWIDCNLAARKSSNRPEYLMVRYQNLVSQPEQELARICGHLHEDYSPSMLVPAEETTSYSSWSQRAKAPVTSERLGKWREQLTEQDVELVEWVAGPHLESFGYKRSTTSPSLPAIARGLSFAAFDSVWRRLQHFPAVLYFILRPTKIGKEEFWVFRRIRKKDPLPSGPKRVDGVP
jgi:hypothetical protein